MKMYEIVLAYREIMEEIDADDGEVTPEVASRLDAVESRLEDKADSYAALIAEFEAEAKAFGEESSRLAKRRQVASNRAKRLRGLLREAMEAVGVDSVRSSRFQIRIKKASRPSFDAKVMVEDIPSEFIRTELLLDYQKAYDAWKKGMIPDCLEVRHTSYVEIR
jgi:hypothetical protein